MSLTMKERQEFAKAFEALDARDAAIKAARKHIEAQLAPFIEQAMQVEEERAALIEKAGVEFVGKCEVCGNVLLSGDQGSRPYEDETAIIFCAAHGMTYGDLRANWADVPAAEDDEDQADRREIALDIVESHLASGGALTDLIPTYEL